MLIGNIPQFVSVKKEMGEGEFQFFPLSIKTAEGFPPTDSLRDIQGKVRPIEAGFIAFPAGKACRLLYTLLLFLGALVPLNICLPFVVEEKVGTDPLIFHQVSEGKNDMLKYIEHKGAD